MEDRNNADAPQEQQRQNPQQEQSQQQQSQEQQNRQENQQQQEQQPIEPGFQPQQYVPVGGEILDDQPVEYNEGRYTARLVVHNTGDRPIQVGSHFHFFEVNRYLEFDRAKAYGCHLNIPSTTAIRFEPGDEKEVEVVAYSGKQYIMGFNGLVQGFTGDEDSPVYFPQRILALEKAKNLGFKSVDEDNAEAEFQKKNQKQK